ncbi:hypothetical protein [Parabacteroides bouchesdurhonensis]|uniref:hypothetical protein n=1 Tax=Parabacteroides bouchesdurhonensis TaxID=1936995 RepID=UPI000E46FFB6|nr:hypothetical protein [Parabacteroides bouchesdurhonensis]RHJ94907.1 hypothetical protein DW095_00240 [Bacteroides sp. AM07-16]
MKSRKSIVLFILFFLYPAYFLHAQSEEVIRKYVTLRKQTSYVRDNKGFWSVSLAGGTNVYFGEKDLSFGANLEKRLSPYGKLTVTRWLSSVWGFRAQIDGGYFKNEALREEERNDKGKFYFMDGSLQVVTNVMNWGTYKRTNRPVSIYIYAGGGMIWSPGRRDAPSQYSPAVVIGGQLNVRMSDYWSIFLEGDGTVIKDNFNNYTGGRKFEGYSGLVLGLTYRFNP